MSIEYRTRTMMEMSKKRDDFARELDGRASKYALTFNNYLY